MKQVVDVQIESLDHLKKECSSGGIDCYMVLKGGLISRRFISYNGKGWYVQLGVDDSETEYDDDEHLEQDSGLVRAINEGILRGYVLREKQ